MTARYAVFSDVHLDSGRRLPIDRLTDQERILNEFIDIARAHHVDGAWFGGDMYHHPHPSEHARGVFARFLGRLRAAGIPLTAITGNALHDIVNASEPAPLQTAAVHDPWLRLSRTPELILTAGDVALVTLPSVPMHRRIAAVDGGDRREIFDEAIDLLLEAARGLHADAPEGWPVVLMGHWACDWPGMPPQIHEHEPVLPLAALEAIGFDLILMGHIHLPQQVGSAISIGPPAHVSFGEEGLAHGCWIVTFDGASQVSTEFVPLSDRRYVTVNVDLTEGGDWMQGQASDTPRLEGWSSAPDAESTVGAELSVPPGIAITAAVPDLASNHLDPTELIAAAVVEQFPLEEAVVKIRYRVTEEQNRRVDQTALKQLALDAGAGCVLFDQPEILRAVRVRVEGFEQGLGEHDALTVWTGENGISDGMAEQLHEILSLSRQMSAGREGGLIAPRAFDPVSLTATNVGLFPELPIKFEDGAMVLLGANGAGKSTVLTCLELALFAKDGGELRGRLLRPLTDQMELTLVFTLDSALHRVRRGYRRTGSTGTATLDLERWDGSAWDSITQEGAKATQALLEQMLGMSREVACASWLLAQGDAPAFLKAEPKHRKSMMGELLDPAGLWTSDAAYAKEEAKRVTETLAAVRAKSADHEVVASTVTVLQQTVTDALKAVSCAEGELATSETILAGAQGAQAANGAAYERHRAAGQAVAAAEQVETNARAACAAAKAQADMLEPARVKLEEITAITATVPDLELKVEQRRAAMLEAEGAARRKAEANTAVSQQHARVLEVEREQTLVDDQLDKAKARLAHLEQAEDGQERCDRCEQILGAEARDAAIVSLATEALELTTELKGKVEAVAAEQTFLTELEAAAAAIEIPNVPEVDHAPALARARQAAESRQAVAVKIEQYETEAIRLPGLTKAFEAAESDLIAKRTLLAQAAAEMGDNLALDQAVREATAAVATRRNILTAAQAEQTRQTVALEHARVAVSELVDIESRVTALQAELDVLRVAERAFGRDGIPVLLVETVLGQIDADANRILRRLPKTQNGALGLRFETQKLQANGKLGEELYVVVERTLFEQDVRTLSGGELSRVSFAVRVALGMLLGRLRGAASRVLILDELPFLDETGDEALVALVRELITDGSFSKVVCVSHSPNVRDAFDLVVEFACKDDVSAVVGARELAAVPA